MARGTLLEVLRRRQSAGVAQSFDNNVVVREQPAKVLPPVFVGVSNDGAVGCRFRFPFLRRLL